MKESAWLEPCRTCAWRRPSCRRVLVVEDRRDLPVLLERRRDGVKEAPPRIHVLLGVRRVGIVAVLADAEQTLDSHAARAERDGVLDGVEDGDGVLARHRSRHVVVRELVDVHAGHAQVRAGAAVLLIAFEQLADDDVGVRKVAVLGDDGRDRQALVGLCGQRQGRGAGSQQGALQEVAAAGGVRHVRLSSGMFGSASAQAALQLFGQGSGQVLQQRLAHLGGGAARVADDAVGGDRVHALDEVRSSSGRLSPM